MSKPKKTQVVNKRTALSKSAVDDHDITNKRQRIYGVFIGNLTMWTTEDDLVKAMKGIGVVDIDEVKFFQHRHNRKSKGFCVVFFASEKSIATTLEKLGGIAIRGRFPVATTVSRTNYFRHLAIANNTSDPEAPVTKPSTNSNLSEKDEENGTGKGKESVKDNNNHLSDTGI